MTSPTPSTISARIAARLHLKDPRVPGTLLLMMLSLGCQPAPPSYPMGGVKNTLDEDVNIRGRIRSASFDAMVGPNSSIWVIEEPDTDASVEIYGATGFNINSSVSFHSLYTSPDKLEIYRTDRGYHVRRLPWDDRARRRDWMEFGPPAR